MKRINLTVTDEESARLDLARGTLGRATFARAALVDAIDRRFVAIDTNGAPCVTDPNQLPLPEKK